MTAAAPRSRPGSASHTAEDFDAAADRYDLLTRLNPGYHRALDASARDLISRAAHPGTHQAPGDPPALRLLDLGCGSGASTRALLQASAGSSVLGIDASAGMLAQAERRDWPEGVRFVQASAQDLIAVCAENGEAPFDGCLAAYLFRNVPPEQRDETLRAVRAVLRPGGWLVIQDYATDTPIARAVWSLVCLGIVLPLSAVLAGHPAIYRYLHRSVLDNDSPQRLMQRLEDTGFTDIATRTTARGGWDHGILHTTIARVPVRR